MNSATVERVPAVSVLVVVHSGMPYLPETVDSVLRQTLRDFELIVVDDGSTDDTPRYLQSLYDDRVRVRRCDKMGLVAVRNLGVEMARAPLVATIDSDDTARPERLAAQCAFLEAHPDCVVVGSQADEIDASGRVIGHRRFWRTDPALRFQMLFGCPFLQPSTMCRREAMRACGPYRPQYPNAEDYDLWSRIAQHGRLANLDQTLLNYRIHPRSMTSTTAAAQSVYCSQIAADYAQSVSTQIDLEAVRELYFFLESGRAPETVGYERLVTAYQELRGGFAAQFGRDASELPEVIEFIQRRLRWHCTARAQAAWKTPWLVPRWLRLAARFDPENGTLRSMAARTIGRLRGGRAAPTC